MQRFFVRKFKYENATAWKNPFYAILVSFFIFLCFLIGFYNYRSSEIYYDVNLKEGKSINDSIGYSVLKIKNEFLASNISGMPDEIQAAGAYNNKVSAGVISILPGLGSYIDKGLAGTIPASNLTAAVTNCSLLKGYIDQIADQVTDYFQKNNPRFVEEITKAAQVLDPSDETMYLGALQNNFSGIAREVEFAVAKMIYKLTKDPFVEKVFEGIEEQISKKIMDSFMALMPPLNPDQALSPEEAKELFKQMGDLITAFLKQNSTQYAIKAQVELELTGLAKNVSTYIVENLTKGKDEIKDSLVKIALHLENRILLKTAMYAGSIAISNQAGALSTGKELVTHISKALSAMKADLDKYIRENSSMFLYILTLQELIDGAAKADKSAGEILLYHGTELTHFALAKNLKVKNYLNLANAHQLAQRSLEYDTVLLQKGETAQVKKLIKAISYISSEAKYDLSIVKKEMVFAFSPGSKIVFFIMIFVVLGILMFFISKKIKKEGIQRIVLFISFGIFAVGTLFLTINFSSADYKIATTETANYHNNNIEILKKTFSENFKYTLSDADLGAIIDLYNHDRYNDLTDGYVYQDNKVLENIEMFEKKVQNNWVFIFAGWVIGTILGALALLKFTKQNGVERFLNTGYNFMTGYLFVLPGILSMLILVFFPLIFTIVLGFTLLPNLLDDLNIMRYFSGFENFGRILGVFQLNDPLNFYYTLFFTILYTLLAVIIETVLGILIAIVLNEKGFKFKSAYQVIFILPWIIPTYISGLLWNYFFQTNGVLNQVIGSIAGISFDHAWFGDPLTGFFLVSFISAWYAFPFIMLVTLSTLQTIDPSMYEAAMIDGASWFQQMFHITIPMIRSTVLPSVLLTSIWTFNNFNLVFLVTRGDNRYDILVTRIYDYILNPQVAAQQGWTYGFASAYSTLIFIVLLIYIFIFAKGTKITEKSF
ncbi:MAG: hypothetical protein A2Y33_13450 [Spirochaetes bacterium GWF1_51_8]|nr:MAG: hypothetical protein A2Y33_13450 [Spirochaetes bacterium GWF1_51_8]